MNRRNGLLRRSAVALTTILGLSCAAADPAATLTVRNGHALAFDGDGVVLYGGADEKAVKQTTWVLRHDQWRLIAKKGPQPRTFAAVAYDDARSEVMLFGGHRVLFGGNTFEDENILGDTWIWNGREWRQVSTAHSPSPRAEAAVAYDRTRRRVVLFGGYTIRGNVRQRMDDTWEWDGERWWHVANGGPSPRNGAAMTYDAARNRTILFGGSGATADTWSWDGTTWLAIQTNSVPGRFNSVMAYDDARRVIVRFGGWNGETRTADTWLLEDGNWRLVSESGPAPRNHSAMTWDPTHDRLVLFGGHDGDSVFGDTWVWNGSEWRSIRDVQPRERVENKH